METHQQGKRDRRLRAGGSRGQSKGCGHSGCRSPAHRAMVPPSGRLWAAWPPNTASAALSGTFTLHSGPAPANCRVPAHRVCQHGARQKAKGVHCTGVQHHKSACKCPIPPLHHHSIHPPAPPVTPTMLGMSAAAAVAAAASVAAPAAALSQPLEFPSVQWPMQDVEVISKIGGPTKVIKVGAADVASTVRSLHTPQLEGGLTASTRSVAAAAAASNISMRTAHAVQTRCHGCLRTATHAA